MPEAPETDVEVQLSEAAEAAFEAQADAIQKLTHHPGWAVLMGFLKSDAEEAKEALVDADPGDAVAVEHCQRRVMRYRWFAQTVATVMNSGFEPETLKEDEVSDE